VNNLSGIGNPYFLLKSESAQGTVEYVIIAAIMAIFALAGARALSYAFGTKFVKTASLRMSPLP